MKRLLVIAPRSIPVNSAEEIVNYKLLRTLLGSEMFHIDLISRRNPTIDYPTDDSLSAELPLNSHHIVAVDNRFNLATLWQHFRSLIKFGCVYKGSHWAAQCLPVAEKLVRKNHYDYVLTKSESAFLVGYYLKKKYRLKWVATWNDPFPNCKYPVPYGQGPAASSFAARRILKILSRASVHLFANPRLRDYICSYTKIDSRRTRIAPHVVDTERVLEPVSSSYDAAPFHIIISGNLRAPRDPRPFLLAYKNFIAKNPSAAVKLSLLGTVDEALPQFLNENGLSQHVALLPPCTYSQSLEHLRTANLAVIIEAPCAEGIFLPTKVSDFMQCGVNIMAVSPSEGVLHDLFLDSMIGYFAPVGHTEAIQSEVQRAYNEFKAGKMFTPTVCPDYSDDYITQLYLNL